MILRVQESEFLRLYDGYYIHKKLQIDSFNYITDRLLS